MFCVHKHCWPYSTDLTLMTQNLSIFIASPYCGRVVWIQNPSFHFWRFWPWQPTSRDDISWKLKPWDLYPMEQSFITNLIPLSIAMFTLWVQMAQKWRNLDKNYANYFQCLLDWTNLYHDIIMFKRGSSSKNTFWVASIVAAPSNRRRRSNGKPEIRFYYAFHTVFRFFNKWCLIKGSSVLHPSIYSCILYVW